MADLAMSNTRKRKRDSDFYTISGINEIVRVGDCVVLKSPEPNNRPYIARVENFKTDVEGNSIITVRWYYWPEEASGGRKQFHGAKELFLSDHYDYQSTKTIEGKCIVHSLKDYSRLEVVGAEDYYSRFNYRAAAKEFPHNEVSVYCKCEMPYNPDNLMIQCDGCKDWFHPECVKMTNAQAKKIRNYLCDECSSKQLARRPENAEAHDCRSIALA